MSNSENLYLEFPKKLLNPKLGWQILELFGFNKKRIRKIPQNHLVNPRPKPNNQTNESVQPNESNAILKKRQDLFSTSNKLESENNSSKRKEDKERLLLGLKHKKEGAKPNKPKILKSTNSKQFDNHSFNWESINSDFYKFPNYNIAFKKYFKAQKCDICNIIGVNINDAVLNKNSKDMIIYEYVLYECSICKVLVHKNCALNETLPYIESGSKLLINWTCGCCVSRNNGFNINSNTLNISNNLNLIQNEICQICLKEKLKNKHLLYYYDNSQLVHYFCLLWIEEKKQLKSSNTKYLYTVINRLLVDFVYQVKILKFKNPNVICNICNENK